MLSGTFLTTKEINVSVAATRISFNDAMSVSKILTPPSYDNYYQESQNYSGYYFYSYCVLIYLFRASFVNLNIFTPDRAYKQLLFTTSLSGNLYHGGEITLNNIFKQLNLMSISQQLSPMPYTRR